MYFKWYFNWIIVVVFLMSCQQKDKTKNFFNNPSTFQLKYAKHFGIQEKEKIKYLFVTENFKDTSWIKLDKHYQKIAALGTIPVFQMYLLNSLEYLVAIDDIRYYCLDSIYKLYSAKKIIEVQPNLQWNYELLLFADPDILITYSNLKENTQLQHILMNHQIQHLVYLDYLEETPLARAEWIKAIGALVGKDSLANQIFEDIEKRYIELKQITENTTNRPNVLTEVMYGDVWYIAGKNSYIAQLISDAGGKYSFDFHDYNNSRPYSFEYVLKYAQDADVWINLHQFRSLQELQTAFSKYRLFKPFQTQRCFNNNKIQNQFGFNDYYESGICLPYKILEDLIKILHPELLPNKKEFYYYYQLPEK